MDCLRQEQCVSNTCGPLTSSWAHLGDDKGKDEKVHLSIEEGKARVSEQITKLTGLQIKSRLILQANTQMHAEIDLMKHKC